PTELGDSGCNRLHEERAEYGAEDRATAAHDGRTTDHGRCDDGELEPRANRLIEGRGALRDREYSRETDQRSGETVGQQCAAAYAYAGETRRRGVAADRVVVPPAGRMA